MRSGGRKELILTTALEVGDLHRHFSEVMFDQAAPLQFIMDSGNSWKCLEERRDGPRDGMIAAVCQAGIPARLGGPRPRGLADTVIAMSSQPGERGIRTRVGIRAFQGTVRLGVMLGGVAIGRRCRTIADRIRAVDPTATVICAELADGDDVTSRFTEESVCP